VDALVVHPGVVQPVAPVLALGAAKQPHSPIVAREQGLIIRVRDPRRLGARQGFRQGVLPARAPARWRGLPAPGAAARLGARHTRSVVLAVWLWREIPSSIKNKFRPPGFDPGAGFDHPAPNCLGLVLYAYANVIGFWFFVFLLLLSILLLILLLILITLSILPFPLLPLLLLIRFITYYIYKYELGIKMFLWKKAPH
jgi:hypothetical protein